MHLPPGYQKVLGTIALAWLLGGVSSIVSAQTQEVLEDFCGMGEGPRMRAQEIEKSLVVLNTTVDVRKFQTNMSFKGVLGELYDQVAQTGLECAVLVNTPAFMNENPNLDLLAMPIRLSHLPTRITAGKLLRELLNQVPGINAEMVLRPGFFEITTTAAWERERSSAWAPWESFGWLLYREDPAGIPLSALEGAPLGFGHLLVLVGIICGVIGTIIWRKIRRRRQFQK
jgi:hypothetical protein